MNKDSADIELVVLLDLLSVRIINAATRLAEMYGACQCAKNPALADSIASTLTEHGRLDAETLERILSLLNGVL